MKSSEQFERCDEIPGSLPRAPRYPLRLRACYRGTPADWWRAATTINMSRSGLLFSIDEPATADVLPEMTLEVSILLALGEADATAFTTIECHCRAVRVDHRLGAEPAVLVAAIIERYTFHRGAFAIT
jgi:hypothetical protein